MFQNAADTHRHISERKLPEIASHFHFELGTCRSRQATVFTDIIAKWEVQRELGDRLPSSGRLFTPVSTALNTPSEPFEAYLKGV